MDPKQVEEIQARLRKEVKIVQGAESMLAATTNPDIRAMCEAKIDDGKRSIAYFQRSLEAGASAPPRAAQPPPKSASQGVSAPAQPPGPPVVRQRATNLDLLKADTPLSPRRISRMLHQLDFKLHVERQYRDGIDKMAKLYQADGDKRSRKDAEAKRIESDNKMRLLCQALDRYRALDVGLGDEEGDDDDESAAHDSAEDNRLPDDPKGLFRRPLSGTLTVGIRSARALQRPPTTARLASRRPESIVVLKVDDTARARTHPSKGGDRWGEEFQIHVDKANELELAIYDRPLTGPPVPVGILWIRLSDVVEELRKRKVEEEMQAGANKWVTADRAEHMASNQSAADTPVQLGPAAPGSQQPPGPSQAQPGRPHVSTTDEGIVAWFGVEPEGRIELHLNFVKSNIRKRPYDAAAGGLGRVGALRKRKDSVHEQNGHKFIQRQFYQVVLCAYCREFLLNAAGMQCDDCRYVCHKKCFENVVTKCISKSNTDTDKDENKINHRIPHRFEPITSISPNWCCHCGMILPLGRKKGRKCSECDLTAHTDCVHLVPDFCGMSPEVANQLIREVKSINSGRTNRASHTRSESEQSSLTQPQHSQQFADGTPPPDQGPHGPGFDRGHSPQPHHSHPQRQDMLEDQAGRMTLQDSHPPQGNYPASEPTQGQSLHVPDYEQRLPPLSSTGPPPPPPGARPSYAQQKPHYPDQPAGPRPYSGGQGQYGGAPQHQHSPAGPRLPQPPPSQQQQMPQPPSGYGGQQHPAQPPPGQRPYPSGQTQQQPPQSGQPLQQAMSTSVSSGALSGKRKVGLDDFNFLAVLGKGNFGKVMLAEERKSNELYAVKVLKKDFVIENDEVESTKSEKRVFLVAAKERHPFLLNLHSCFQTETRVYFVMEYVSGGDLMLHIQREQFTPRRAKFYAAEVLLALEYFHENGIIYRDLKLDNILLTLDGHVKLADYGLCKEAMWYGQTTSTFCGTPEFMAPEILLEQRYGRAVDWWAFGVLIYEMLLGQSPFRGDDEDEIFDAILEDEPLYPIHMPRDSVSVLQKLLTRDPQRRLGSGPQDGKEIKGHLFFKDISWDDMYHKRIASPFFPQVQSATDVSNFDSEFTTEQPTLTPVHSKLSPQDQKEFMGFSWVAPWAE